MSDTEQQINDPDQKALDRIQEFRPIDDVFMRCLLRNNKPLAEYILRILMQKDDLIVTECETQKDLKRLAGSRSLCLDAHATDTEGQKYDVEIQREDKGADPHRARYHSSALDVENLKPGQEFDKLPNTYVIFITENDIYGMGEPFYPIERINLTTGKPFNDGEHILYVNGAYRGDSPIGRLMEDFNCKNPDDMHSDLLASSARYYKNTPEGVKKMCKIMEDMVNEAVNEAVNENTESLTVKTIKNLMETLKLTAEDAMKALKMSDTDQQKYAKLL